MPSVKAVCVAMFYCGDKTRSRTEQEERSRGVRRKETFTFHSSPSHPSSLFALVPNTFSRLMCSCKETIVLRAENTGVTRNV